MKLQGQIELVMSEETKKVVELMLDGLLENTMNSYRFHNGKLIFEQLQYGESSQMETHSVGYSVSYGEGISRGTAQNIPNSESISVATGVAVAESTGRTEAISHAKAFTVSESEGRGENRTESRSDTNCSSVNQRKRERIREKMKVILHFLEKNSRLLSGRIDTGEDQYLVDEGRIYKRMF